MPLIGLPEESAFRSPILSSHRRKSTQQSDIAKAVMMANADSTRSSSQSSNTDEVTSLRNVLGHTFTNADSHHLHNGMRPPPQRQSSMSIAMNDTPATTAPNSPRMSVDNNDCHACQELTLTSLPIRQNSGTSTPRVRPTTLDIPGLTRSKARHQ